MATLSFLDPPKSPEHQAAELARETDPCQERFRAELPGVLLVLTGLIMPVILAFTGYAILCTYLAGHR